MESRKNSKSAEKLQSQTKMELVSVLQSVTVILCVQDSGRGFTRPGPPAWTQMKPNTQSVSLTMPENQAAHVCSKRQQ